MSKPNRHIVALGGGGFSMEPDNPLLDRYIVNLSPNKNPRVCFIPTASGDAERYIGNFYQAFAKHHPQCRLTHLPLFVQKGETARLITESDIFYVGGGNTFNMLLLWNAWGVDKLLRQAYEKGKVFAGISAGANCWFEQFLTDSTGRLTMMPGLGWLPGSFSPHFHNDPKRPKAFLHELAKGAQAGFACDNSTAIHFENEGKAAVISSVKGPSAYSLTVKKGKPTKTTLPTKILKP